MTPEQLEQAQRVHLTNIRFTKLIIETAENGYAVSWGKSGLFRICATLEEVLTAIREFYQPSTLNPWP